MENYSNELTALMEEVIRRYIQQHPEIDLTRIIGPSGLTLETFGANDINIKTVTGKAYYNGVEIGGGALIGTGALNTVAIWQDANTLGTGHAANDLSFDSYSGIKFYHGSPGTFAGNIRSFNGVSVSDLMVEANNGSLYLKGLSGIRFASSVVTDIAMSGYKITGLAAATANGDALRYEQLVGSYLLLAGGTLTGDLVISKSTAKLFFKGANSVGVQFHTADNTLQGAVLSDGTGDLSISATKDLLLGTDAGLKLTIADALITAAVKINAKDIVPNTSTNWLGDSTHFWQYIYGGLFYVGVTGSTITDNTGNMRFTVAAGKKFEFVVSA